MHLMLLMVIHFNLHIFKFKDLHETSKEYVCDTVKLWKETGSLKLLKGPVPSDNVLKNYLFCIYP